MKSPSQKFLSSKKSTKEEQLDSLLSKQEQSPSTIPLIRRNLHFFIQTESVETKSIEKLGTISQRKLVRSKETIQSGSLKVTKHDDEKLTASTLTKNQILMTQQLKKMRYERKKIRQKLKITLQNLKSCRKDIDKLRVQVQRIKNQNVRNLQQFNLIVLNYVQIRKSAQMKNQILQEEINALTAQVLEYEQDRIETVQKIQRDKAKIVEMYNQMSKQKKLLGTLIEEQENQIQRRKSHRIESHLPLNLERKYKSSKNNEAWKSEEIFSESKKSKIEKNCFKQQSKQKEVDFNIRILLDQRQNDENLAYSDNTDFSKKSMESFRENLEQIHLHLGKIKSEFRKEPISSSLVKSSRRNFQEYQIRS